MQRVTAIILDNSSDVCKVVATLCGIIDKTSKKKVIPLVLFHIRCIAHVINIAVKECFNLIYIEIFSVRSIITAIKSSVKWHDLYEKIIILLVVSFCGFPHIDFGTRWSLTFSMINKLYKLRMIFNA